ncbi:MAG TPA: hypothetical protein V6D21_09440 [Candidatus Obscuribacterales bacterium]
MRLLLDTHTLLWFFMGNSQLTDKVHDLRLLSHLSFYHKDPFDRLLIVQSIQENIPILSKDIAFDAYPTQRIWD